MWGVLASFLVDLIARILGDWEKIQTAKEAGALAQEVKQHGKDTEIVAKASAARDAAVAPGVPDDPRDFRD